MNIHSTYNRVFFFNIKVMEKRSADNIEFLSWSGLRWELRIKYDWYFKYRAALLQVKYPRYIVETTWGSEPAQGKTLEELIAAKSQSKRATITKYRNKLAAFVQEFETYKSGYSKLFPIEGEVDYKRYVASIELAEAKIKRLETELKELTEQS